jgi:SAM-dependent methyltransferase
LTARDAGAGPPSENDMTASTIEQTGAPARQTKPKGYTKAFYSAFNQRSYVAAGILLREVASEHPFDSMVDFGCGSGTWLRAAHELVRERGRQPQLVGVDGEHVRKLADRSFPVEYRHADLEARIELGERFDLAISLEVAEHLSPERGPSFVEDICRTADVVLFGASIPGQGGLEGGVHHVNERWQEYWADLFREQGYACIDLFREKYWMDPRFERCPYYVANAFLYARIGHGLAARCRHRAVRERWWLNVVHPRVYEWSHAQSAGFIPTVRSLPGKLARAVRKRLARR